MKTTATCGSSVPSTIVRSLQKHCYLSRLLILMLILGGAIAVTQQAFAGIATKGVYYPPAGFFQDVNTLIDFDRFPSGASIPTGYNIRNEFAELGVTFSVSGGPASRFLYSLFNVAGWGTDFISPSNSLAAGHNSYYSDNSSVTVVIDFDPAKFNRLPTAFGLVFTDSAPNNPFTVCAFDTNGAVVDSMTINTADNNAASPDHAEDTFVGLTSAGGIRRVEYTTQFMLGSGIFGFEIDNVQFSPTARGAVKLVQVTDRGGGGPCTSCCGIDHRQPVLNPAGTEFAFSSLWNQDEVLGNLNPERNRELFRYSIASNRFVQATVTAEGHNVPSDYLKNGVVFSSSSPGLGNNTNANVDIFTLNYTTGSVTQLTDTTGPIAIESYPAYYTFADGFSASVLNTQVWTWQTPKTGPAYSLTNQAGKFRITIPSTNTYDCWSSVDDAPKLAMLPTSANWRISGLVDLKTFGEGQSHMSGLFVKLGVRDYLMFGFCYGTQLWAQRSGSTYNTLDVATNRLFFQIERAGTTYYFRYRADSAAPWQLLATAANVTASPQSVGFFSKTWAQVYCVTDFDEFSLSESTCPYQWFSAAEWATLANLHADATPDGRRIVWTSNRNLRSVGNPAGLNPDENYEIYWKDFESGEVRQLTVTMGGDDASSAGGANLWPRVSADGQRVVFASNRELTGTAISSNRYGLFEVTLPAGTVRRLTDESIPVTREFPAFGMDDDGDRIVFALDANLHGLNPEENFEIFALGLGSGVILPLSSTPASATNTRPILSGDGLKVAFLSNSNLDGSNTNGIEQLWLYHFDEDQTYPGRFVKITGLSQTPTAREGRTHWLDWCSLDYTGSHLAFCCDADPVGLNSEQAYEIFLATFGWDATPLRLRISPKDEQWLWLDWPNMGVGALYTLEYRNSLSGGGWAPVPPVSQWPAAFTNYTVPILPEINQRFYRVVVGKKDYLDAEAAPQMRGVNYSLAGFAFTFRTVYGRSYTLLTSTNLVNWQSLTNWTGTGGVIEFGGPPAPTERARFYRLQTP